MELLASHGEGEDHELPRGILARVDRVKVGGE